jgi:hypothetical protein
MNETTKMWREHRRDIQGRHARAKAQNLTTIRASGLLFVERDEVILFRNHLEPKVDFYPSTGRWRIPGEKRTYGGGAGAFLNWYAKQRK